MEARQKRPECCRPYRPSHSCGGSGQIAWTLQQRSVRGRCLRIFCRWWLEM